MKIGGNNTDRPNIARFIFINKNLKYKVVKDLKNNLPFLEGQSGKVKRYFYKTYNGEPYRLFTYGESDEGYKQIVDFFGN